MALITGCIMSTAFAEVHEATIRVLQKNGVEVLLPPGQGCCGALHTHGGDLDGGRELARINIAAFEGLGVDAIIVNAAGCGGTLKEYGHLLHDDPAWHERAAAFSRKVRDIHEYLAGIGLTPERVADPAVLYFHDVPPDVKAEAFQRGEPRQSMTPMKQPWPLPGWPTVPTRVLAGRDDRLFPAAFQRRIARERLGLAVDEIEGGHLVALSRPAELADRLESLRAQKTAARAVFPRR